MLIRGLPIATGLLPLVGINLAYWIGVDAGILPSCIPYLDGCTSISATGRYPPGDRLFRAVMLPQAVLLGVTWYLAMAWLRSLAPHSKAPRPVLAFGLAGAAALIIYVSNLGSNEPLYEFMRRFGIYIYFLATGLAQLILTLALERSRWRQAMLWVVITPWILGLANFAQKALRADPDMAENAIEWIVSVLMQVWFMLLYVGWRKTGFRVAVTTD